MKRNVPFLLVLLTLTTLALADPQPQDDPIGQSLFPPEMLMKYQTEIGLDENQQTTIKGEIQKAQSKFMDFQWQMQTETQKMMKLLQAKPVDEVKVLAQADKVMDLEREVKKTQLTLLIRIKNSLSEQQQSKLMELRSKP